MRREATSTAERKTLGAKDGFGAGPPPRERPSARAAGGGKAKRLDDLFCRDCPVGRFAIYGPTYSATPEAIRRTRSSIRAAPENSTLMRAGEIPAYVYTLRAGWAFRYMQLPDRRRQIFAFFVPGDTICFEALHFLGTRPLPFSVRTLTPVEVCAFQIADLNRLVNAGEAERAQATSMLSDYWGAMEEQLISVGRRRAAARIARLLIDIRQRLLKRGLCAESGAFDLPLRQDHLADALGLTPIHVNRTLSEMRRQGLIEFQRGSMDLRDMDALRRIADEE